MKESSKSSYGDSNESEIRKRLIAAILSEKTALLMGMAAKPLSKSRCTPKQAVHAYACRHLAHQNIAQLQRLRNTRRLKSSFTRFLKTYCT